MKLRDYHETLDPKPTLAQLADDLGLAYDTFTSLYYDKRKPGGAMMADIRDRTGGQVGLDDWYPPATKPPATNPDQLDLVDELAAME